MTFISYAQNFEDVMLWRALRHVERGFYIDVGANDPTIDSVTLAFYERGWRGINIEPMQQYYDLLRARRPEDVNLPVAVGDRVGELVFYDVPDTGLSTMDREVARQHEELGRHVVEQKVHVTTLTDICNVHVHGPVHFLKIDVEGYEKPVLQGMDLRRWRPWILVVEATRPQSAETVHEEWEGLVAAAGYRFAYFDGLNHYYVAEEHPELMGAFKAPPNVFDGFILRSGHAYSYPLDEYIERTTSAEARALQAELRTQQAERNVLQAEDRTRQAEERVRQAEHLAQQTQARAQHEIAQAHAELRAMEVHLHQQATRAEAAEAQLHRTDEALRRVYASISWRVTRPLRGIRRLLGATYRLARRSPALLRAGARRAVLAAMRPAVKALRRSDLALRLAGRFRQRYPGAWERLVRPFRAPLPAVAAPEAAALALVAEGTLQDGRFHAMLQREWTRRQNKKQERAS